MKIVVVGDIHGYGDSWKKIIELEKDFDKIIFLGDYFDNFKKLSSDIQVSNFKEIIALKESNPLKVEVLIGNHDLHYIDSFSKCSGFNVHTYSASHDYLIEQIAKRNIKVMHQEDGYLFSHAGLTKQFVNSLIIPEGTNPINHINALLIGKPYVLGYVDKYGSDPYGDDEYQGPLWVRPRSLNLNSYKPHEFIQIVGHTHMKEPSQIGNNWFCDSLPSSYLVIEDNNFIEKKCE